MPPTKTQNKSNMEPTIVQKRSQSSPGDPNQVPFLCPQDFTKYSQKHPEDTINTLGALLSFKKDCEFPEAFCYSFCGPSSRSQTLKIVLKRYNVLKKESPTLSQICFYKYNRTSTPLGPRKATKTLKPIKNIFRCSEW